MVLRLALPHDRNSPSHCFVRFYALLVSLDVAGELLLPIVYVAGRHRRPFAPGMPVPKAAVNKDRDLPRRIGQIR